MKRVPAAQLSPRRLALVLAVTAGLAGCAAAAPVEGLDGLNEQSVATELSSRGMTNLLDYYFRTNNTPEEQQRAIKTQGALRELRDAGDKIPYAEKVRRVKQAADGIDAVLPSLNDPGQMMSDAATLKEFGVDRPVNNIEYWGEDPVTQAQLKPVADAVVKLLDAASKVAKKQADAIVNQLNPNNQAIADRWDKLDQLTNTAAYSKNMSVYYQCLALSQKDPLRKKLADGAIKALADYDDATNGVQARVRNMIAKLNMAAGEYKEAKAAFASVSDENTKITPVPNPFEQYEARYFSVVSDLLEGNLVEAQKDDKALDAWQGKTLPGLLQAANLSPEAIAGNLKGIGAAERMLRWRIAVLEGDLAKTAAGKDKANAGAEAILLELRKDNPQLAGVIDEQLVKRMPADKKIDNTMPVSLLQALVKKAVIESYKQDPDKPDPVVLNKGLEAAGYLLKGADKRGLSAQQVGETQLSVAGLQEKLGMRVEAANSYLDYAVSSSKLDPRKATEALDHVGFLVFDMKKNAPAGWTDLYARFLPIAIAPPYNHKELAYSYAEQLRALKNYKESLKYFQMVPPADRSYASAQFKIMLVLNEMLDTKQDPAEHGQTVAELMKTAEVVKKLGDASKDPNERTHAAQATLVIADHARIEDKDPKRALEALANFETLARGLPAESELLRTALIARVNSYMAAGDTNKAVDQLTRLLTNAKGDEGIALISQLLDQLDKEFKQAQLAQNLPTMRVIAKNEASLTHFLVDWSNPKTQAKASVSKYYYQYVVFDARTQRIAGSLAEDPAERKKLLTKAADGYVSLKAMHNLYIAEPAVKAQIDAGNVSPDDPDPNVATGLALTKFDLGDYKTALDQLGIMIAGKKLGTPQIEVKDPATGEVKVKDNDLYWEATFKYLKSMYEVAKAAGQPTTVAAQSLKNVLVRGGIPDRWQDDFEGLRKEVAPDFNPNATAEQPATAPAAGAAASIAR